MKQTITDKLHNNYLVAVVRGQDDNDAYEIAKKCYWRWYLKYRTNIFYTFYWNTIEKLSKEYKDNANVVIGAGTVLDRYNSRIAIMKGQNS